jgi:hypothetical protein
MMEKKLLTSVLMVLAVAGMAMAADVINVDIRGFGYNSHYVGNGAYDVGSNAVWQAYIGGWGIPVGSSRSEGLATIDQEHFPSNYAAQVMLGDDGVDHGYQWGAGFMDDGFVANTGATPKLDIFGPGAYQGIYDIYVYGKNSDFILNYYGTTTTKSVTGVIPAGTFTEGGNYVVFSNVDLNDTSSSNIYLQYTGMLSALQFVKKKLPVDVNTDPSGTKISAGLWDIAGDRNHEGSEPQTFGPDTYPAVDPNTTRLVGYIEAGEYMGYDVNVTEATKGRYSITLDVNIQPAPPDGAKYPLANMNMYLDSKFLGSVKYNKLSPIEGETNAVSVNLFPGIHTVEWRLPQGSSYGFNLYYVKLVRTGNISMTNCSEVGFYGYNYAADTTGDCVVDLYDLDFMADNWMKCNDPDPTKCF